MRDEAEAHRKAWDTRGRSGDPESAARSPTGEGFWTKDGDFQFNDSEAAGKWKRSWAGRAGDVPVPFPYHEPTARDWWGQAHSIESGKSGVRVKEANVRVKDLIATQTMVEPKEIRDMVAQRGDNLRKLKEERVSLINDGGKLYIYDGHHRAVSALLRGDRKIKATIFYRTELAAAFDELMAAQGA